jgi:hypothetical protein
VKVLGSSLQVHAESRCSSGRCVMPTTPSAFMTKNLSRC